MLEHAPPRGESESAIPCWSSSVITHKLSQGTSPWVRITHASRPAQEGIAASQLTEGLQRLGYSLEAGEAERLLEHINVNRDGVVAKSEFLASQIDWDSFQVDYRCGPPEQSPQGFACQWSNVALLDRDFDTQLLCWFGIPRGLIVSRLQVG